MPKELFEIGDLVQLITKDWEGHIGIVSQPISFQSKGHILINLSGEVLGIPVALEDVSVPDDSSGGYVQLAFKLLAMGSNIIEKKIL
jgi:hypothetical protein